MLADRAMLALPLPRDIPRVRYGELPFPKGGPLTKLTLLKQHFPEHSLRFNIIYLLSAGRADFDFVKRAKKRGARVVVNQNGVYYPAVRENWQEANGPMQRMLELADYVFYQSEFSRTVVRRFLKAPPCAAEVLHNAVDTSRFQPAQKQRADARFTLLSTDVVADSVRMRMFAHLLESLRALKSLRTDWTWEFAGSLHCEKDSPDYRPEAEALIRKFALEGFVRMKDSFDRRSAASVYEAADIYLHDKYNDCCSNAALEAMACGLPIVCGATGGMAELVGSDAGVGVPAPSDWDQVLVPDPVQYARAISEVMDRLPDYSQAARRRAVERFDVTRWIARHREVFRSLLGISEK